MCFRNIVTFAVLTFVMYVIVNRNPTQKIEKLFQVMMEGIAGNENIENFHKIYTNLEGNKQHGEADEKVANSFYNLVTDFYEYGWGDSFHFGYRTKWENHIEAIKNSQRFIAQKLQVKDMDRVLDMGCGIGGPLREVVRVTGANVTGLTINEHQVKRGKEITKGLTPFMQKRCHFVVQDYLNIIGMEEEAYDAAFYMESSLHCENRTQTFSETYRLLKPGGRLVALEYVTLDKWDQNNKEQSRLMKMHLHGNGAAKTPSIEEDLQMFRDAGFEIEEHFDLMQFGEQVYGNEMWPWWGDLQFNYWPDLISAHPWVRGVLPYILDVFAKLKLVPGNVPEAARLMNMGGDGLSGLGKLGAITPQYYVLAVKPHKK